MSNERIHQAIRRQRYNEAIFGRDDLRERLEEAIFGLVRGAQLFDRDLEVQLGRDIEIAETEL